MQDPTQTKHQTAPQAPPPPQVAKDTAQKVADKDLPVGQKPVLPPNPAQLAAMEKIQEQTQQIQRSQVQLLQEKQEKLLESDPREKQRAELLEKITQILRQNGGIESNVPLTSEYWNLTHQYRGLK